MEHADALERIEIAAAEPDGLERLMAGDTPEAAAVAGHLAGCPACVSELARIRQTAAVARDVIAAAPDPALRERTLAFVRAVGRDRSAAVAGAAVGGGPAPVHVPEHGAVEPGAPAPVPIASRRGASRTGWLLAAAAGIVVVVAGVGYAAGGASQRDGEAGQRAKIVKLADTAATALRINAQPDARTVALAPEPSYPEASGTLAFSPSTGDLVAVAWDLAPEEAGQEYGCWVEVDGTRHRIGRMYWAGDMWTWAGPVEGLDALAPGAVFGVSLGPVGGGPGSQPVLTGEL